MNVLDCFSGIGGFALGLERVGMRTVAFCEKDAYCRAVLAARWPDVPCYPDIRTLPRVPGVDLLCGGVPCQPASLAGKRRGRADERWLWPEFLEVVRASGARWILAENPRGLVSLKPDGLDWITGELADAGYRAWPFIVSANDVGAPHLRERVFIVAYAERDELRHEQQRTPEGRLPGRVRDQGQALARDNGAQGFVADTTRRGFGTNGPTPGSAVAHTNSGGLRAQRQHTAGRWWSVEPDVGRVAHGVPARVDRLRALGNAVVPQAVEAIGRAIMRVEEAGL